MNEELIQRLNAEIAAIRETYTECYEKNAKFNRENPPEPDEEVEDDSPCHTCEYESKLADLMEEAVKALDISC